MQNSIYKIKYLLFLSWDWEAWCLTVWGVIHPHPQRNTAWNKGRKCFYCLRAPNNLIRTWSHLSGDTFRIFLVFVSIFFCIHSDLQVYQNCAWIMGRLTLNCCNFILDIQFGFYYHSYVLVHSLFNLYHHLLMLYSFTFLRPSVHEWFSVFKLVYFSFDGKS